MGVLTVLAALILLTGCPDPTGPDPTDIAVTSVGLDAATLSLEVGGTGQLTATVSPADASDTSVAWSSSAAATASVSDSGLVTGVAPGSAVITVTTTDGEFTATCAVTVTEPGGSDETGVPVTGVSLDYETVTTGNVWYLTAAVEPADATNTAVTWESDDTDTAVVDQTGKITAVATGTAVITVTTSDGGKTAQCEVTVRDPDIYIGGGFSSGLVPGYYLNGTWTALDLPADMEDGTVFDLCAYNGSIYAAGYVRGDSTYYAGYWLDGEWTPLQVDSFVGSDPQAAKIVVDSGTVYVAGTCSDAGTDNAIGILWVDGTATPLTDVPEGASDSLVNDLAVVDGDVYVAGGYSDEAVDGDLPGYWLNGQWNSLAVLASGGRAVATAVTVDDGVLYIAGRGDTGDSTLERALLWTDGGDPVLMEDASASGSCATGILFQESGLYVAGYLKGDACTPCYWKGGTEYDLTLPTESVYAWIFRYGPHIAARGTDIYVATGTTDSVSVTNSPTLWTNGTGAVLDSGIGKMYLYALILD